MMIDKFQIKAQVEVPSELLRDIDEADLEEAVNEIFLEKLHQRMDSEFAILLNGCGGADPIGLIPDNIDEDNHE